MSVEVPGTSRAELEAKLLDPDFSKTAIALSWRRSQELLGDPSLITDVPQVPEEMLDAHLQDMFQAPLARFADHVQGTGLGLLLADAGGRILQRWTSDTSSAAHLDRIGTMRGAVLAEDVVGTNGVGTVAATGRRIQIVGAEHFAQFYSTAVCTGAPVRHPMTGKLLAVVTISSELTPRADLLWPLLNSVTSSLEQHVLEIEQPAARRLFQTFLSVSRQQEDPVVAFGPHGLLVQNSSAGRLAGADLALIQDLCTEEREPNGARHQVELSTGSVSLHITGVGRGSNVVVVLDQEQARQEAPASRGGGAPTSGAGSGTVSPLPRPVLVGRAPAWLAVVHEVASLREASTPILVAGGPGTGKLSVALGRPARSGSSREHQVVDAAEAHVAGTQAWLQKVAERVKRGGPLVVRGLDTLEPGILDGLRSVIDAHPRRGSVVVTMSANSPAEASALALKFEAQLAWVPSLRDRSSDIAPLWRAFSSTLRPGAALGLHDDALNLLRAYRWPGNVRELRSVVAQLATRPRSGLVTPEELPESMREGRSLTLIERLELEAIRNALHEAQGNRAKAAEILGLSRATVYRKMKAYRLAP